jgi:hypothetical protein
LAGTSGALVVGRWLARRRGDATKPAGDENDTKSEKDDKDGAEKKEDPDEARARAEVETEVPASEDESDENAKDGSDPKRPAPKPQDAKAARKPRVLPDEDKVRLEGFVCQLGDVLMRLTGEEAWLAGGVVLSEDLPVAVLFVAPEAGHDHAIYARARSKSIQWLEALDPSAILVAGEPPSSVEHGVLRFDRARRLPLRPRRIGVGAPDVGDAVIVAEYASAGAERLLVLKANTGVVRAYRGLELEEGSFEVIASGESTLES